MFISHKSNAIQHIYELEWECRCKTKGLSNSEYWEWVETIKDENGVPDFSGETGYTIVECRLEDEDVLERLKQLESYRSNKPITGRTYNIKYYASKRDSEIADVPAHKDEDGKDVAATYVQSHFIGDDAARDARILADEWTDIRKERDRLLTNSDWTQGSDSPLASGKKTEWATYRTKLRTLPEDQKDKKTYASITWPSEPS